MESANELKGEHILCGDFNIHVEDLNSLNTNALYSITESFGYTQIVNEATHENGGTLDLVFLKSDSIILPLAKQSLFIHDLCYSLTSDHKFIEFVVPFLKNPPTPIRTTSSYRDYKAINIADFCFDTKNILDSVENNFFRLDVNDATVLFDEALSSTLDIHTPVVYKCFTKKRTDFTNPDILKLRRLRRRYERLWRKHGNTDDYNKFKHYQKEVHKTVHSSKNEFYQKEFLEAKGDQKKTYRLLI